MSETNGVGHNSGELTDEQQQALFFSHLGQVRRQKEKLATATADLRNLLKKAKADGFSKKDIDFALDRPFAERHRADKEADAAAFAGNGAAEPAAPAFGG